MKVNPYYAQLSFKGKKVHVGNYPTPTLASAAYERKRRELGAELQENNKQRDLPQGVTFDKASKTNPYKAYFGHGGKEAYVGL